MRKSNKEWIKGSGIEGIVTIGDPRLDRKTQTVKNVQNVKRLCSKMVQGLRRLNGAGLAAPQIGKLWRIIVVEVRKTDLFPDRPESPLYVMINPKITEYSRKKELGWEGCFSVPGLIGKVPRYHRIKVKYQDRKNKSHHEFFSGYVAKVIQHEIDHLDTIEFTGRMKSLKTLSTVENWKRSRLNQKRKR